MFMATKARWNTEGDSSASRSSGWMLDDIESRTVKRNLDEVGLLVEAGLDAMSVVLLNTPVGLLALALEALDDISLSVFGDRYAKSSAVFCGAAVDLGDMLHLVTQDLSESGAEVCDRDGCKAVFENVVDGDGSCR
ncbi:hypothetical protein BASA81_016637 [Batrachochytrium salamandrivorans]|nr:hypothetical protein BASA81_016637 [Batrachochytrium salamandrivorans]